MSEDYISEIISNKCQELDVSLHPFCPSLNSPDLPTSVLQDIDLHLECDDDGNFSLPATDSTSSVLSHSVIGHNVNLRVSFPLPNSSSKKTLPTLKCSFCDSQFNKQSKLAKHLLEVHEIVKNFQCSDCSFGTTALRLLRRHCLRKHLKEKGGNRSGNELCGVPTTVAHHLDNSPNESKEAVTGNATLPQYTTPATKSVISDDPVSVGSLRCDIQDLGSKSSDSSCIYMCSKCSYKTSSEHELDTHFTDVHDSRKDTFKCKFCDYTSEEEHTLLAHQMKHSSHKCEICQKDFPSASALKRHSFSHRPGRDFACSYENCEKQFKNPQSLQSHLYKVHRKSKQKAKNLESEQKTCGKSEKKKSNFVCSWTGCGKSFRDNYNLKAHLCIHTGETPIQCPHCVFKCIQKASLICHIKKMHT